MSRIFAAGGRVVKRTTLIGDRTGALIDALLRDAARLLAAAHAEQAQGWPSGWSTDDRAWAGLASSSTAPAAEEPADRADRPAVPRD